MNKKEKELIRISGNQRRTANIMAVTGAIFLLGVFLNFPQVVGMCLFVELALLLGIGILQFQKSKVKKWQE